MTKKLLFGMMAAGIMFATGCQSEIDVVTPTDGESTVSINLGVPQLQMGSRAFSDGTTATKLQYEVYEVTESGLNKLEMGDTKEDFLLKDQISFRLLNDHTYRFVFWAASEDAPYTVNFEETGATMAADYSDVTANDENLDAFYAVKDLKVTGSTTLDVDLYRPFAQINIGTNDLEDMKNQEHEVKTVEVKVSNAYKGFDLMTGYVTGSAEAITFKAGDLPEGETFPVSGYDYLAMNYVLVGQENEQDEAQKLVIIEFTATNEVASETTTRRVGSVPVQRNYRTNIYGQIFTSDIDLNVEIKPDYEKPDYNYDQLLLAAQIGGKVTLTDDVEIPSGYVNVGKDMSIDLNGNNITFEEGSNTGFVVGSNGSLHIEGNGELTCTNGNPIVWANGGDVTITGGTFDNPSGHAVYVYSNKSKVVITGGYFKATQADWPLNILDSQRAPTSPGVQPIDLIEVRGGTFVNFDPSNNTSEGPGTNYVPEGYEVVMTESGADKIYTVVKAGTIVVSDATSLSDAVKTEGANVFVTAGTYESFPGTDIAKGVTIVCEEGTVFEGSSSLNINGATVEGATFKNESGSIVSGSTINGNFKNCNFEASENGIRTGYLGDDCTFEQCVFSGSVYAFHIDGGRDHDLTFKQCTFKGFSTFAATINQLTFDGCVFNGEGSYNVLNLWCNTTVTNCEFDFTKATTTSIGLAASSGTEDASKENTHVYVFTNCTVNGASLTANDLSLSNYTTAKATIDGKEYSLPL